MKRLFKILIVVFVVSAIIGGILKAMSIEKRIVEDIKEVAEEVKAADSDTSEEVIDKN